MRRSKLSQVQLQYEDERRKARAAVRVEKPVCKTTGPWQIECYNTGQEEWNLFSSVRIRPHMSNMALEEAFEIIKIYNGIPPEFRSVMRLHNTETGDVIMNDGVLV